MNRENKKKRERPFSSTFKIMTLLIRMEIDKEDIRKSKEKLFSKEFLLKTIDWYINLLSDKIK